MTRVSDNVRLWSAKNLNSSPNPIDWPLYWVVTRQSLRKKYILQHIRQLRMLIWTLDLDFSYTRLSFNSQRIRCVIDRVTGTLVEYVNLCWPIVVSANQKYRARRFTEFSSMCCICEWSKYCKDYSEIPNGVIACSTVRKHL